MVFYNYRLDWVASKINTNENTMSKLEKEKQTHQLSRKKRTELKACRKLASLDWYKQGIKKINVQCYSVVQSGLFVRLYSIFCFPISVYVYLNSN